jgi:hypothetical protein
MVVKYKFITIFCIILSLFRHCDAIFLSKRQTCVDPMANLYYNNCNLITTIIKQCTRDVVQFDLLQLITLFLIFSTHHV